ncbi:MAG: serine-rich protein [Anaerolineaceae bacterium]|nr:serine-rich protein [Anaerolineaceae bacterium]
MATIREHITDKIPWLQGKQLMNIPNDLEVYGTELLFNEENELDALVFQVIEREGMKEYTGYRAVRLLQLRYISLEARRDAGLLQKMRTVMRGLYGAQVDLVYLAAGVFETPKIGIVQCYGVSVFSKNKAEAIQRSLRDLSALKAGLVGVYRQIRLEPLSTDMAQWLARALEKMPYAIVAVGHPDPRENARGGDTAMRDPLTAGNQGAQQYSQQQNELLFRGMSSLEEEFLLMLLASHVRLEDITLMLSGLLEDTSVYASHQLGTRAASFGISLPAILTGGLAQNASQAYGNNHSSGVTEGVAAMDGVADSQGQAHTEGHASTRGWAYTVGVSETDTTGLAATVGSANTQGTAHTDGTAVTNGSSHSQSSSVAISHADNSSYGVNGGLGGSIAPAGVGLSANLGGSGNWGSSDGVTASSGSSSSSMHSETSSQSDTVSQSNTQSQSNTDSQSHSTTKSEAWTTSGAETDSVADTNSTSSTKSHADTKSTARSEADGVSLGQNIGRGISAGMSVGVAPSFSLSNAYQWQDDPYILLTDIMRTQRKLLDIASREGAFYTDFYALAGTEQGLQALMGLIPEAFHGTEDVVAGVQTRTLNPQEQAYIGLHARAFTPSTRIESIPEAMSGYADSTLLTMLQVAAYTAPGMFEQGAALTTQEETPAFAFYADMPGAVTLGRQWSTETGQLTDTFLKLAPDRHFHTAFVGDTGFGKSIAAERLAYETTRFWQYRTIVLDFGQGWRKALNWPGMRENDSEDGQGHVDIRQLFPGSPRPLRWNILQVPKRIEPGRYRSMVAELFANAGRMGARQLGFMRRALTELYVEAGVLTGDPKLQNGPMGHLQDEQEVQLIRNIRPTLPDGKDSLHPGTLLASLAPADLQALAVYRSKTVDVSQWVERLKTYQEKLQRDQVSRTSLEGVLLRLEQFSEGHMARQYGPSASAGDAARGIEDLGLLGNAAYPWGITVIEGGAEMDEYSKAALLALLASILYSDAVARRREMLEGKHFPPMQIFFEEANKVLTGVSGGAASDQGGGESGSAVSHLFQTMWRDGRKYSIFLHLMAQTVSELPSGILSSCANVFVFQTKDPKDRDLILPHLGRSEKGMVNTEYKRYLARIPRTYAITKLGYSDDVLWLEPVLVRPLMLRCSEPADQEIVQSLGAVSLERTANDILASDLFL